MRHVFPMSNKILRTKESAIFRQIKDGAE